MSRLRTLLPYFAFLNPLTRCVNLWASRDSLHTTNDGLLLPRSSENSNLKHRRAQGPRLAGNTINVSSIHMHLTPLMRPSLVNYSNSIYRPESPPAMTSRSRRETPRFGNANYQKVMPASLEHLANLGIRPLAEPQAPDSEPLQLETAL